MERKLDLLKYLPNISIFIALIKSILSIRIVSDQTNFRYEEIMIGNNRHTTLHLRNEVYKI